MGLHDRYDFPKLLRGLIEVIPIGYDFNPLSLLLIPAYFCLILHNNSAPPKLIRHTACLLKKDPKINLSLPIIMALSTILQLPLVIYLFEASKSKDRRVR